MKSIRLFLLLSCCMSIAASGKPMVLGLVNYATPAPNEEIVERTAETLRRTLAGHDFEVRRLDVGALGEGVRTGDIALFLSGAGFYREMVRHGARDLATAVSSVYPNPNRSEGTAIIVLSERKDLDGIGSLRGQALASLSGHAFAGHQIAMEAIFQHGYQPDRFFSRQISLGSDDIACKAMAALRNRAADVVFLKHCLLEQYLAAHPKEEGLYRVVNPQNAPGECRRSTDLYPTWTLATTASFPPELSRKVTQALLAMSPGNDGMYWGVCTDFSTVDKLFRDLRIGPFAYLREWTVRRFVASYWPWLMLLATMIAGLAFHALRVGVLVRRRTAELEASVHKEIELREKTRVISARLEEMQKFGVMSQLSSMLAHEMRQPLMTLEMYMDGIRTMAGSNCLDSGRVLGVCEEMLHQTRKINGIIEKVRSYSRSDSHRRIRVNLTEAVAAAAESFAYSGNLSKETPVETSLGQGLFVQGDRMELELLVRNLLKNALEAVSREKGGRIRLSPCAEGDNALITVTDNGEALSDEEFDRLETAFGSTKKEGFGIGLVIARGIVEKHLGRITFERNVPQGLTALVRIPLDRG